MRTKTLKEVKALVGTTWERDGKRRTVTRIEDLHISIWDDETPVGDVYWRRPGGRERTRPFWLPNFWTWLAKAKRVEDVPAGA